MTMTAQNVAEKNKQLVSRLYDAFRTADVDTFFAGCSPDLVLEKASSLYFGGIYRGFDQFGGLVGKLTPTFDFTTLKVHRLVADGDFVVAWMESWRQVEPGLEPSNQP